jgi:hypothetical protein
MHISSSIRTTSLAHLLLELAIVLILDEEFKLCTSLQPPLDSALPGPHILLTTLFPNTVCLCSEYLGMYLLRTFVEQFILCCLVEERGTRRFWAQFLS